MQKGLPLKKEPGLSPVFCATIRLSFYLNSICIISATDGLETISLRLGGSGCAVLFLIDFSMVNHGLVIDCREHVAGVNGSVQARLIVTQRLLSVLSRISAGVPLGF